MCRNESQPGLKLVEKLAMPVRRLHQKLRRVVITVWIKTSHFGYTLFFHTRMLFFRARLNILIFLPILAWKYSCITFFWACRILQILQSDWFRERAALFTSLLFVNEQNRWFLTIFVLKPALLLALARKKWILLFRQNIWREYQASQPGKPPK